MMLTELDREKVGKAKELVIGSEGRSELTMGEGKKLALIEVLVDMVEQAGFQGLSEHGDEIDGMRLQMGTCQVSGTLGCRRFPGDRAV